MGQFTIALMTFNNSPAEPTGSTSKTPPVSPRQPRPVWVEWLVRLLLWAAGLAAAGLVALLMVIGMALAVAYPNLPDISDLSDYRPKLPMRVYSSDGVVIGEFGEERRNLTPIKDIPKVMKDAVLAIEDARFFSPHGEPPRRLRQIFQHCQR